MKRKERNNVALKVAIIGCENAGYVHLKNFLSEPEVKRVVAVDVNKKRLDEIGKRYGIEIATDYRHVIRDIDTVVMLLLMRLIQIFPLNL